MPTLKKRIPAEEISAMNAKLGAEITRAYASVLGPDEMLTVLVTLKGAAYFAADLTRHIGVPLQLDFIRLSSYGSGTRSSGQVQVLQDLESSPSGKHVLVLDEIVDSGRTLDTLLKRLRGSEPKSVKVCSLLSKPSRREVEVAIDYLGREVPDEFLVGYGLDYAERYRNLADICILEGI